MSDVLGDLKPNQQEIVDGLTKQISLGVSLVGNRLTIRGYVKNQLVDMHMVILEVTTLADLNEEDEKDERYSRLFARMSKQKAQQLKGDLYYAEHGEHLQ